jgi:type II secretion system protein G
MTTAQNVFPEQPAPTESKNRRILMWTAIGCAVLFVPCIGLVATIVVPNTLQRFELTKRKKAEIDVAQIAEAVRAFRANNGALPESLELLLIEDSEGAQYLRGYDTVPADPWGRIYEYDARDDGSFEVRSPGPNGLRGDVDDVAATG